MQVDIYDVRQSDGSETIHQLDVDLGTALGDDAEEFLQSLEAEILQNGAAMWGGGASPLYRIIARFEYSARDFVGIHHPKLIFIGVKDRAAFDKLDADLTDHGEKEGNHVLTKTVDDGRVMVVFQHWLKSRTTRSLAAENAARKQERAA